MSEKIIGIMGPGTNPTLQDIENAYALGQFCAKQGYVTMTGGSKKGVMNEALKGAKEAGGRTLGILAFADKSMASDYADIVIVTAMGSARNNINILTGDVIIACGLEAGTLSEIALALKADKKVILLTENIKGSDFLKDLGKDKIYIAKDIAHAKILIQEVLEF